MSGVFRTARDGPRPPSRPQHDIDEEFMQFVTTHSGALRRRAYLITGSWADGDDLVQEALTKVYVAWPRITSPQQTAFSYTRTTMVRLHLNARRSHGREIVTDTVPEPATTPGYDDPDRALALTLEGLLADLPEKQRLAVVLRFYDDLTVPQIAAALDVAEGTVKSQLSRAMATLRGRLGEAQP